MEMLDRQPAAGARRTALGVAGRSSMDNDLAALLEVDSDGSGGTRASTPAAAPPLWEDDGDEAFRSRRVVHRSSRVDVPDLKHLVAWCSAAVLSHAMIWEMSMVVIARKILRRVRAQGFQACGAAYVWDITHQGPAHSDGMSPVLRLAASYIPSMNVPHAFHFTHHHAKCNQSIIYYDEEVIIGSPGTDSQSL